MSGSPFTSKEEVRRLSDALARGETRALEALYRLYGGLAHSVAMAVLGQRAEAEDVVHEAFLEVWRRAAHYDATRTDFPAWLATITRSRAIDRLRTRSASSRAEDALALQPLPAEFPSPEVMANVVRQSQRLRELLQDIPEEQRQVLLLAYFDGLSQSEIAARTGTPLGTVKTRTRSALARLARLLASGEGP